MTNFLSDYEPVEDRLRAFWNDHPNGRVETFLDQHEGGDYIVRAVISRDVDEPPAATGYAHDSAAQLPANMKASALEVCETSAIGRALANLGYAPKGKRPSREEMSKSAGSGVQQAAASSSHPAPTSAPLTTGQRMSGRGLAGDGERPTSSPAPTSAPEGSGGEKTAGVKDGADTAASTSPARAATKEDATGVGDGEAPAPASSCRHDLVDPVKPNGKPYPKGYARCVSCKTVVKVAA